MKAFFDLPSEIRNVVYNNMRADDATSPAQGNSNLCMWAASRQLHQEVTSHFYQHSHFSTTLLNPQTHDATILPPIPDRYLKYLRQLTIRTTIGQPNPTSIDKVADSITALGDVGATFEVLCFELSSKISEALGMCVDDPVLHTDHPITYALRTVLAFGIAKTVQVELKNVWFASGVLDELRSGLSSGRLEVFTDTENKKIERPLIGNYSTVHLDNLDLDEQDVRDARVLQEYVSSSESAALMPSSLSTALSDLDRFFIAEYLDGDPGSFEDLLGREKADSLFDEPMFEIQGIGNPESAIEDDNGNAESLEIFMEDEEELTEDDDIEDEEIIDVHSIDAIVGNMKAMEMQRVNMKDICYMTNFAPDSLGKWVEKFT